jgi:hypothetical protein
MCLSFLNKNKLNLFYDREYGYTNKYCIIKSNVYLTSIFQKSYTFLHFSKVIKKL